MYNRIGEWLIVLFSHHMFRSKTLLYFSTYVCKIGQGWGNQKKNWKSLCIF